MLRHILIGCLAIGSVGTAAFAATRSPPDYRVVKRYQIGGPDTSYDYVRFDAGSGRLFVAQGSRVHVLDADSGKKVGEISGLHGVHGIEIIPALNAGFTSNGSDRTVTKFDAKTLQPLKTIKYLGLKPDAIRYDAHSQRLFVVNGGATGDVTVIEPESGAITGTVELGAGKLEQIAFDDAGRAFVNDEERNVVHVFDTHTLKPLAAWKLAPGEEPTGIAVDTVHQRLFAACGNNKLVVLDMRTAAVVATPSIGAYPDGVVYDAASGRIFTSNYEGTLSVLQQDDPDHYAVLQTAKTEFGARTLAMDTKTGRIFLPTAKIGADKRTVLPGTFVVLVVAP